MTGQIGLRERKRIERRQAIEAAAVDLFERHGFDATTIEDIAAVVDIAPRTFFSYFATKEDVVLADYNGRLELILTGLDDRPLTEPPWAALRAAFAAAAADYEAQRDQLIRRFTIMTTAPSVFARSLQLQAGWEDALTERLARRTSAGPSDPAPGLLAAAALAAMRASLQHWLRTGHAAELPAVLTDAFDRLAAGLV